MEASPKCYICKAQGSLQKRGQEDSNKSLGNNEFTLGLCFLGMLEATPMKPHQHDLPEHINRNRGSPGAQLTITVKKDGMTVCLCSLYVNFWGLCLPYSNL